MGPDVLLDRGLVDPENRSKILDQHARCVAIDDVGDLPLIELTADPLRGSSFGGIGASRDNLEQLLARSG